MQYATWGPIGSSVVFVVRNNIYYRPDAEEKKVIEITNDGLLGHIYNGIPDWVYEGKQLIFLIKKKKLILIANY